MGKGGEIGDGGALDTEEMQTGLPWQHLVETINDGDQSIRAMDRAPAHAADTDKPGALDHMRERHCTAFIITGMTSLNDRHEGRIDPGIFSAQPAFDVGPDGTGHAVEHLVAIAGHFLLDAIVEACPPLERIGRGKTDVVVDGHG